MNDIVKVTLGFFGGVITLLALFFLFPGSGTYGMGSMMQGGPMMQGFGNGPGGMMGGWFGSWWMLVPILFWAGFLALIAWAVVRIFPANRPGDRHHDPAEEVLRERFARGEIDGDEYDRGLAKLRGKESPTAESLRR
jgi:putative membrane protein